MSKLSIAELRNYLSYDPHTGAIIWLRARAKTRIGSEAGWTDKTGQRYIRLLKQWYTASHLAWAFMTGEWPTDIIDRIDNNPENLRWNNLRMTTQTHDKANTKKNKNNTSGFRGVSWDPKNRAWRAQIGTPGKKRYLGVFASKEEAAAAYNKVARELHGEFVRLD